MYKPIELDDETKIKISAILKYYRNAFKIKQSDFIRYKDASVCSGDTYSRIENGKIIKRNSIYVYLLYQIHAIIAYFPSFWKIQQTRFNHLYRALCVYDMECFQLICEELFDEMKDTKDFLGREINELLHACMNFYHHELPLDDDLFQKLMEIYAIFPTPLQDIVKDMLFQNAFRFKRDITLAKSLYDRLHMEDNELDIIQIDRMREYLFEERYLECHALALHLEDMFTKEHNVVRLLDVYEVLFILYRKVQNDKQPVKYFDKFQGLIQQHGHKFHHAKYTQSLYVKGLLHYYQKRYVEAYQCFKDLMNSNERHFLPSALFINIIAEKTQDEHRYYLKPLSKDFPYPKHLASFYEYFIMRHDGCNAETLEAFLVRHVLPYITPADMIYWEPLRDELLLLIKDTKHYYIKKKLCPNCM